MTPASPRYLFCINSGRSGSQFLAGLFATADRVAAFHEAEPTMTGDTLRLIERQSYAETYAARRHKAAACRALLAAQPGKSVYAETSHMFIKTFFDVAVAELAGEAADALGVVILRRELARTVKSFAELGIYTERNLVWPAWMPSVEARTRAVEPAAPMSMLTGLERTVAYLVDIEARAERFRRDHPQVSVFETRLEALGHEPGEIGRLFAWAGLKPHAATFALAGQPANTRARRKAVVAAPTRYEDCVDAVERYLERCRHTGIRVPDTLALAPWPGTHSRLQNP